MSEKHELSGSRDEQDVEALGLPSAPILPDRRGDRPHQQRICATDEDDAEDSENDWHQRVGMCDLMASSTVP